MDLAEAICIYCELKQQGLKKRQPAASSYEAL